MKVANLLFTQSLVERLRSSFCLWIEQWKSKGSILTGKDQRFVISVQESLTRTPCKVALASESRLWRYIRGSCDFLNGSRTEGQQVWEESVSPARLGEEAEDRKYWARRRLLLRKARAFCLSPAGDLWTRFHQLPSQNKLGSVQSARLSARRTKMAQLHQHRAYSSTSEFTLRDHLPGKRARFVRRTRLDRTEWVTAAAK